MPHFFRMLRELRRVNQDHVLARAGWQTGLIISWWNSVESLHTWYWKTSHQEVVRYFKAHSEELTRIGATYWIETYRLVASGPTLEWDHVAGELRPSGRILLLGLDQSAEGGSSNQHGACFEEYEMGGGGVAYLNRCHDVREFARTWPSLLSVCSKKARFEVCQSVELKFDKPGDYDLMVSGTIDEPTVGQPKSQV